MSSALETSCAPLHSTLLDEDMAELVEAFIVEMPERIAAFESALAERDWPTVRRLAHRLKGSAGGHGFELLGAVAGTVEFAVAQGGDDLLERVHQLLHQCRRVCSTRTSPT